MNGNNNFLNNRLNSILSSKNFIKRFIRHQNFLKTNLISFIIKINIIAAFCVIQFSGISISSTQKSIDMMPDIPPSFNKDKINRHTGRVCYRTSNEGGAIEHVNSAEHPDFNSFEEAAMYYLTEEKHGIPFGLKDPKNELMSIKEDTVFTGNSNTHIGNTHIGRTFVKYQQLYKGIPVLGGEIIVQLSSMKELLAIIGEILPDIDMSIEYLIDSQYAENIAVQRVAQTHSINANELTIKKNELCIYHPDILEISGAHRKFLVWKIIINSSVNKNIDEYVLVDANLNNSILLQFNISNGSIVENDLLYFSESGAIYQAISEILSGEEAVSQMGNPLSNSMPDRMSSPFYQCIETYEGNAGVDINKGIAQKAAWLLTFGTNGKFFNNQKISMIGYEKVKMLFHEAYSNLLTSAASYSDLKNALMQSCRNLGFSFDDYTQIAKATDAVEMDGDSCRSHTKGYIGTFYPLCEEKNGNEEIHFRDDLENGNINWNSKFDNWAIPQTSSNMGLKKPYATSGKGNIWCYAKPGSSDTYIDTNKDIKIYDSYLHFNHSYSFDNYSRDGAFLEFSTDQGVNWQDAGPYMMKGKYNGNIAKGFGNPQEGRRAFVRSTRGYISTIIDLNNFYGKSIRLRFRVSTDSDNYSVSYGWFIDDITIYRCDTTAELDNLCNSNINIQSTRSGDWDNPSTWNLNRIPNSNDIVKINSNHTITGTYNQIRIKGLCNNGYIKGKGRNNSYYSSGELNIKADMFIRNAGKIWGTDGNDSNNYSSNASPKSGENIKLDSMTIFNTSNGNIQAGRGGNHNPTMSYHKNNIQARGKDGGNIDITGIYITNSGIIGPQYNANRSTFQNSNVDGGNGGAAINWTPGRYNYGNAYGGNGGDITIKAEKFIQNTNGSIGSGNGGFASAGTSSRRRTRYYYYPGKGGNVTVNAPYVILNGEIHAGTGILSEQQGNSGGNQGGYIHIDPKITKIGGKLFGASKITIAGNNNWDIDISNIETGGISAQDSIEIAVGNNGSITLANCSNDALIAPNITFYGDKINLDENSLDTRKGRQARNAHQKALNSLLKKVKTNNFELKSASLLYEFDIIPVPRLVYGNTNQTVSVKLLVKNNSLSIDTYEIEIKGPKDWNMTSIPKLIEVPAISQKELEIEITLPPVSGYNEAFTISASSVTVPNKMITKIFNVIVESQYVDIEIENLDDEPLAVNLIANPKPDVIIDSYSWDLGNGIITNSQNTSYTFNRPGAYPVTLTVIDTNGNSEIIRKIATVSKSKILLLAADEIKQKKVKENLAKTGLFSLDDIDIIEKPSTLTINDLNKYNAVLVWTNSAFIHPEDIGDVLKEYVDAKGGLIIATFSFSDNFSLSGGIMEPNYCPFLSSPIISEPTSDVLDMNSIEDPDLFIFNQINSAPQYTSSIYYSNPDLNVGAELLALDTTGNNLIAINPDHNIVGISIYPGNLSGDKYADTRLLFANALKMVANETSYINVSSTSQLVKASSGICEFSIFNTEKGEMKWFAESNSHWITIKEGEKGINDGIITLDYEFNHDNEPRKGSITIYAVGAKNSPVNIEIIQNGNANPEMSVIDDQTIYEEKETVIYFNTYDQETPPSMLNISASSSNTFLVPNMNISFNNPGITRFLKIIPAPNRFGETDITVTVNDGQRSSSQTFKLYVNPVNDPPTFTPGADQVLSQNAGPQIIENWAMNISSGFFEDQNIQFFINTENKDFFSILPEITPDGTLTYTPRLDGSGSAIVNIYIADDGNNENGGNNISQVYSIRFSYDYLPDFVKGNHIRILEDDENQVIKNWATQIKAGPNDPDKNLTFHVSTNRNDLFSELPAITPDGTLTFKSAQNAYGMATVSVYLTDSGNTNNTSVTKRFIIAIDPINDPPDFTAKNIEINEDSGYKRFKKWADNINCGPENENNQSYNFYITNNNPELFSIPPEITNQGTLTFQTAPDANGTAKILIYLKDNGGTVNAGNDTSLLKEYKIIINPVNDPPSFEKGQDYTLMEDVSFQTITNWAKNITTGPDDEINQDLEFILTTDNDSMFDSLPAISQNGTLSYSIKPNANGSAIVKIILKDNGGLDNNGNDTSEIKDFRIVVKPVNDCPSFTKGNDIIISLNQEKQIIENWAINISPGPNELEQNVQFKIFSNSNSDLFVETPEISFDGTLSFTPAQNAFGEANISIYIIDDNETINENGCYKSQTQTFKIKIGYCTLSILEPNNNNCNAKLELNNTTINTPFYKVFACNETICINALPYDNNCSFVYWSGNIVDSENPVCFNINKHETIIPIYAFNDNTFEYKLTKGWNLISLPFKVKQSGVEDIFPDASVAYKYEKGSYYQVDKFETTNGYWLNIPSAQTYTISGESFTCYTKALDPGWHLMGSISEDANVTVDSSEDIEVMYKFEKGSYIIINEIPIGVGYWVKIKNRCVFKLCFE